jgi:hypothetical protein
MPAQAVSNRHYLVLLASLMSLMLLSFQPLAAAVFEASFSRIPVFVLGLDIRKIQVRDTQWTQFVNQQTTQVIGLNQSEQFKDLSGKFSRPFLAGRSPDTIYSSVRHRCRILFSIGALRYRPSAVRHQGRVHPRPVRGRPSHSRRLTL